jgi:organic hydroperoxide reductase OsmC/OhrA
MHAGKASMLIEHRASIRWAAQESDFLAGSYSRAHTWQFDGGLTIRAAASPHNVPVVFTDISALDPEEAFVASVASCHMLTFLYLAFRAGLAITEYADDAAGEISVNEAGASWISSVTLRPRVVLSNRGNPPAPGLIARLHHEAHAQCFIANSIKSTVHILPAE